MAQTISKEAIANATGKTWDEWLEFLESIDARHLTHKEIAQRVYDSGCPGWWSQSVTVAYEQHIGRRQPGQDNDGRFSISVSKTAPGSMDDALDKLTKLTENLKEFNGVAINRGPETSQSDKWRYWHCGLADGSRISVAVYQKTADRASLGLGHEKLPSAKLAASWRIFWKEFLKKL